MNMDVISENFSLDEAEKFASCDWCKKKFDMDNGIPQLEDHFISCLARLKK